MTVTEAQHQIYRLLSNAGCSLPASAQELIVDEQADRLLSDPSWFSNFTLDTVGELCRLFDPAVQLTATERYGDAMAMVGETHKKGVLIGAYPITRQLDWNFIWSNASLIPHARLLGDIVQVILRWARQPSRERSRFAMTWSNEPGWVVAEPEFNQLGLQCATWPTNERCASFEYERLALVSLIPTATSSLTAFTMGTRCLRLLQADLAVPFTNPGVADIGWSCEDVLAYHDHSTWTFRALRSTRTLAVAIRFLGESSDQRILSSEELGFQCDSSDAIIERHPEWPEVVVVSRSSEWHEGCLVHLRLNSDPKHVALSPNPIVLETAVFSDIQAFAESIDPLEEWNVVASPAPFQGRPWRIDHVADRIFVRSTSCVANCVGHLSASLQRRFITPRISDIRPAAMIRRHAKDVEILDGFIVNIDRPEDHCSKRVIEAVRRTTNGLIGQHRQQKEFIYVQA